MPVRDKSPITTNAFVSALYVLQGANMYSDTPETSTVNILSSLFDAFKSEVKFMS
jgi:hypothetical protein